MKLEEIIKAANILTTKNIIFVDGDINYQDSSTIYINKIQTKEHSIFHEIIHFIAAKKEDRFKDNLSYGKLYNYGYNKDDFFEERIVGHIYLLILNQYKNIGVFYKYALYLTYIGIDENDKIFNLEKEIAIQRLNDYINEFNINPINYFYNELKLYELE